MAESKPYLLPNTQGRYVTVTVTNNSGEVYRINDDGTRTIYADYFVENNRTIIEASAFASEEFDRNLAQNNQGYNRTISNSVLEASGNTNSRPDPNQPGTPGTSTPTSPPNQNKGASSADLRYPLEMRDDQDRIKFQALTYSAKTLPSDTLRQFEAIKPTKYSNADIPIFLPIQASISDQNSVGWEPDTLNPIELRAVGLSLDVMKGNTSNDVTQAVLNNFKNAIETLRDVKSEVRTYLAGQAVGVNNLLSRLNGKVLNPNLELLFQGPQLRPFNFTFKLSPRSAEEAKVVKKIIRYFKKNMAPIVGDQGLFIQAPNIFKIEYQYGKSSPHPGLNLIKECALTNCSVDYTPLGSYMTYPDGTMVSYTLSLQFQEIEPVYSRDYKDPDQIEY